MSTFLLVGIAALALAFFLYKYKQQGPTITESVSYTPDPVPSAAVLVNDSSTAPETPQQPPAQAVKSETPTALNATESDIMHGQEVQEKVETESKQLAEAAPPNLIPAEPQPIEVDPNNNNEGQRGTENEQGVSTGKEPKKKHKHKKSKKSSKRNKKKKSKKERSERE